MEHPVLYSICAFSMLMVLVSWVGYRTFYKPGKFLKQLGGPVIVEAAKRRAAGDAVESEPSAVMALLRKIGDQVPSSEAEVATLRTELVRGGFRSDSAPAVFYGLRIVCTLAMLAVSVTLQSSLPLDRSERAPSIPERYLAPAGRAIERLTFRAGALPGLRTRIR